VNGHLASWDSVAQHPDVVEVLSKIATAVDDHESREHEVALVYEVLERLYDGSEEATFALATWLLKQAARTSPPASAERLQDAEQGIRWMRRYVRLYAPKGLPAPTGRPRQGRAPRRVVRVSRRRRQAVARAGPRSDDDPPDPDPPLGGSLEAGGSPPICPRCGTNLNVRRVPFVRGWSCRWCLFENWRRDVELQTRRALDEAERITREAA
jgi:hypothetical protein